MRSIIRMVCTGLLVVFVTGTASAQRPRFELGLDAVAGWHFVDHADNVFAMSAPLGGITVPQPVNGLRFGLYFADRFSLEPSINVSLIDFEGDETMSQVGVATSLLYFFRGPGEGTLPFIGVGGNYNTLDDGEDTLDQVGIQAFTGANVPLEDKLYLRLSVGGGRFFENNEAEARWAVFGTIGFSFMAGGGPISVARR